jgi:nitrite reductase/ring-hydroxylating ferredoxin subunit
MRDNLRPYRAIRDAVRQGYPGEPQGRCARHVVTLAALISGIVASKRTQLATIAAQVPERRTPASRLKRCARWVDHTYVTPESSCVPYAEMLLAPRAWQTLVLVIDGSVGGRGGLALMLHGVSKGRALPLAWVVRRGKKGHGPEALPITLIEQVSALVPPGAQGVVLGDGECDGTGLQHPLQEAGWSYGCRTGSHVTASWHGTSFRLETGGACSKPGTRVAFPEARMTRDAYGPVLLLCWWAKG